MADKLGLSGNPVEIAEKITNKARNRKCIQDLKLLKSPRFGEVSTLAEILNLKLEYPIIIKPTSSGSKRGISVVHNESELAQAVESPKTASKKAECNLVVEEFIGEGMECSVESVSIAGQHFVIQITQKICTRAPLCVEISHHQPAPLSAGMLQKIIAAITEGLSAIGLTNDACHTEIKIKDDNVYLIEFNACPGGDGIASPLTNLCTGINYLGLLSQAETGELQHVATSKFRNDFAGLCYVVKQTEHLMDIFKNCEAYDWFYKKHLATEELVELKNNNFAHTNYFIYHSEHCNTIAEL